jgi:hypothetical protein
MSSMRKFGVGGFVGLGVGVGSGVVVGVGARVSDGFALGETDASILCEGVHPTKRAQRSTSVSSFFMAGRTSFVEVARRATGDARPYGAGGGEGVTSQSAGGVKGS